MRCRTKLRIPPERVCTSYLLGHKPGPHGIPRQSLHIHSPLEAPVDTLRIGLRKGLISLPTNPHTPVVCVGPGTGVAPMCVAIEQRIYGDTTILPYTLVTVLRTRISTITRNGNLVRKNEISAIFAYSCGGSEGVKRTYVQDLTQDAQDIWTIFGQQRGIFIIPLRVGLDQMWRMMNLSSDDTSSSNKMPTAVREAVQVAVDRFEGRSNTEAVEYVAACCCDERDGRLIEECWSSRRNRCGAF
ncbi:hypothetical protein DFH29DRAFT_152962 [Suillus ampliporus]|nr:hypothetical protein DFH29DRAFT_152962 [Suillus ampliporus]